MLATAYIAIPGRAVPVEAWQNIAMTWRDDLHKFSDTVTKIEDAMNVAEVIFIWLCILVLAAYGLYRAFRS
jgi:hypothetical protein